PRSIVRAHGVRTRAECAECRARLRLDVADPQIPVEVLCDGAGRERRTVAARDALLDVEFQARGGGIPGGCEPWLRLSVSPHEVEAIVERLADLPARQVRGSGV